MGMESIVVCANKLWMHTVQCKVLGIFFAERYYYTILYAGGIYGL